MAIEATARPWANGHGVAKMNFAILAILKAIDLAVCRAICVPPSVMEADFIHR